jgi:hypothetical protein
VKNLERVQGDERDAILITAGYGKNPEGRMLYRFGPLNQQGGERRLNVAVTRARWLIGLISSFSSADMDPARLKALGAQMLRDYVKYCESGGTDLGPRIRPSIELNPFERDVLAQLTSAGHALECQVGASGSTGSTSRPSIRPNQVASSSPSTPAVPCTSPRKRQGTAIACARTTSTSGLEVPPHLVDRLVLPPSARGRPHRRCLQHSPHGA